MYCNTERHASSSEADKRGLQRIIKTAERITGCPLPSLKDNSRVLNKVKNILKDSTHPGFTYFSYCHQAVATDALNQGLRDLMTVSFLEP